MAEGEGAELCGVAEEQRIGAADHERGYATIREIAVAEKINESYVGRILRLTLLAPNIVEAIMVGRHRAGLQLDDLLHRFPVAWQEQSSIWERAK